MVTYCEHLNALLSDFFAKANVPSSPSSSSSSSSSSLSSEISERERWIERFIEERGGNKFFEMPPILTGKDICTYGQLKPGREVGIIGKVKVAKRMRRE